MIDIILTSILVLLIILAFFILRSLSFIKISFDEILVKMMKDHETYILTHNRIIKEYKNKFDDIVKIQKDINTIKGGLKQNLEDLKLKLRSLDEKDKK